MNHNRDSAHGALESAQVSYITDKIAKAGMIETANEHLMLLQFIPAKNNNFFRMVFPQRDLYELPTKGASPTGDQDNFL
jgi:hypothetical protein